jgi:hypothetical protein
MTQHPRLSQTLVRAALDVGVAALVLGWYCLRHRTSPREAVRLARLRRLIGPR